MSIEGKKLLLSRVESIARNLLSEELATKMLAQVSSDLNDFNIEIKDINSYPVKNEYLQAFLSAKRIEGRSDLTLIQYERTLEHMYEFVKVPTIDISVYHLRSYLALQKDHGASESYMDCVRRIFTSYFNWLQKESLIRNNPSANLAPIKQPIKVKKPYSSIEIEKLKTSCTKIRDKAIVMFLNATGCRVSEVVRLNRTDINFNTLECKVLGKGNKERVVFLDEVTAMVVKEYLDSRTDDCEALFINAHKCRMLSRGYQCMLAHLGEKVGVEHCHPHKFRRTLATNLTGNGMPIQEVAAILGHEKLDTTMRYVSMNKQDIHHSYNRYNR